MTQDSTIVKIRPIIKVLDTKCYSPEKAKKLLSECLTDKNWEDDINQVTMLSVGRYSFINKKTQEARCFGLGFMEFIRTSSFDTILKEKLNRLLATDKEKYELETTSIRRE